MIDIQELKVALPTNKDDKIKADKQVEYQYKSSKLFDEENLKDNKKWRDIISDVDENNDG